MNRFICYLAILQLLIVNFNAIGQLTPCTEKVFLQADREIYIAGEELIFTCHAFDIGKPKSWINSNFAYLVLRNSKNVHVCELCLKLTNSKFSGSLYLPDTLSTGLYQLVVFTNYMRNAGETSFYTKEILIANRFDKDFTGLYLNLPADSAKQKQTIALQDNNVTGGLSILSEKRVFATREKIKVTINAPGLKDDEIAHVSLFVREKIPQSIYRTESGLFRNNLHEPDTTCHYLPEIKGIILSGRALSADDKPIAHTRIFLSVSDTLSNLQFTKSNDDGYFRFLLNDYYNDKKLFLTLPDFAKGSIALDDKYDLKVPYHPSGIYPNTRLTDYLIRSQNIVQVQKTYQMEMAKKIQQKVQLDYRIPLIYPPVSDPVYPADFVALPDFVEISREILPLLKIRKSKGTYHATIISLTEETFFDQSPLIFLDGVPINDINQIIHLGTKNINKIETFGIELYDGGQYYPGILSVFTKENEINNVEWKSPVLTTKYKEFYSSSICVAPVISKATLPDFRQLLYLEPSLTCKANDKKYIEFQASDNVGEYEIVAEGITNSGNLIKARAIVKVVIQSK